MKEKIENIVKESAEIVLDKMGIKSSVTVMKSEEGSNNFICNIKIDEDASLVIGQGGENLRELQHIIRLLVRKKSDELVRFIVDINSYKKEKNSSVVWLAEDMAKRAIRERRSIALRPMSAYERRIVHMTLAENKDIKTESIGDGDERKVIIKIVSHI